MIVKYCEFVKTGPGIKGRVVIGSEKCLAQPHENCEDCWVGEQFKELKTNLKKAMEERNFLIKYLLGGLDCNKCPCNDGDHCCGAISTATCIDAVEKWIADKMKEGKKNDNH